MQKAHGFLSEEEIIEKILPRLGLSQHSYHINQAIKLLGLEEPILLGLLVAPTWAGALLALAGLLTFLLNQPLKILMTDWQRGRQQLSRLTADGFWTSTPW